MRFGKFGLMAAGVFALAQLAAVSPSVAGPTVGTFSGGNCYPFLCNDSHTSLGQSIDFQEAFSASAFSEPITINSITFFFDSADGGSSLVLGGTYTISFSYAANPVGSLSSTLADNVFGPQDFFATITGGADTNPTLTITGNPFFYDPSLGHDLLMEISVLNQDNVLNGSGNGYMEEDVSKTQISRAYCIAIFDCTSDEGSALVT